MTVTVIGYLILISIDFVTILFLRLLLVLLSIEKIYQTLKTITVINVNAAVTMLEQRPEKNFQALSGIRTHGLCSSSVTAHLH